MRRVVSRLWHTGITRRWRGRHRSVSWCGSCLPDRIRLLRCPRLSRWSAAWPCLASAVWVVRTTA